MLRPFCKSPASAVMALLLAVLVVAVFADAIQRAGKKPAACERLGRGECAEAFALN